MHDGPTSRADTQPSARGRFALSLGASGALHLTGFAVLFVLGLAWPYLFPAASARARAVTIVVAAAPAESFAPPETAAPETEPPLPEVRDEPPEPDDPPALPLEEETFTDLPLDPFGEIAWKLSIAPPPPPPREVPPPAAAETPAIPAAPEVASAAAGKADSPALLRENPPPTYPRASVRNGERGTVLCRLSIAADGTVEDVRVLRTSGHPRLDRAAVEALSRWRFQPATVAGRAVPSFLDHPVTFRLEG